MQLFRDLFKAQPSASAVHHATALGNEHGRKHRALPFRAFIGQTGKPVQTVKSERKLIAHDATTAKVPFRYDPDALGKLRPDQMPRFLGAITDQDSLDVRTVPLASLVAVQNRVDPKKVEAWASGAIKSDRLPVVVHANGNNLIADGHHRLAGAWLRGDTMAQVRFKDLESVTNAMKRAADWSLPLEVKKSDPDQRLIFGWASVVEKDGQAVVDKQGDIIPVEELEKAAYDFVLYSRTQSDMHDRLGVGRLVESMMFTKDKQAALGIDIGKIGWFVGFRVDDDALWAAHKSGARPEFSIGGKAHSQEV